MRKIEHDDLCPCTRYRAQDEFCTCGAVARKDIIAETSDAFGKRLRKILSGRAAIAGGDHE